MLKISNVGPSAMMKINNANAKIIFALDKILIPFPSPLHADIRNNTVTIAMMMNWDQKPIGTLNK